MAEELAYETPLREPHGSLRRAGLLVAVFLLSLLTGAAIGFSLNMLNAAVSSEYFVLVLSWDVRGNSLPVQHAAMLIGVRDGLLGGIVFGLLFVTFVVFTGWRAVAIGRLAPPLLAGVAGFVSTVLMFGGTAFLWATLHPPSFIDAFPMAATARSPDAFAWVGGSIWGATAGVAVAILAGAVLWTRQLRRV